MLYVPFLPFCALLLCKLQYVIHSALSYTLSMGKLQKKQCHKKFSTDVCKCGFFIDFVSGLALSFVCHVHDCVVSLHCFVRCWLGATSGVKSIIFVFRKVEFLNDCIRMESLILANNRRRLHCESGCFT